MRILSPYTGLVADVAAFFHVQPKAVYRWKATRKINCDQLGHDLTFTTAHVVDRAVNAKLRGLHRPATLEERRQYETHYTNAWQEFMRIRRAGGSAQAPPPSLWDKISQLEARVMALESEHHQKVAA